MYDVTLKRPVKLPNGETSGENVRLKRPASGLLNGTMQIIFPLTSFAKKAQFFNRSFLNTPTRLSTVQRFHAAVSFYTV